MPEVLITHRRLIPEGPHHQLLKDAGFSIRAVPDDVDAMQADVLIDLLGDAEAVIAGTEPFNRIVIETPNKLRVVARCGVGFDTVDVDACDEKNIVVTTTLGTNHHSVAEHALAMMLAVYRGFPGRDLLVRNRRAWNKNVLPRFAGSTVGIVGLGRIGQSLAMRLPSLQAKILAFEPYPNEEFVKQYDIELTSLEDLLSRSDAVSLHSPVFPETVGMINRETLALMKSTAILVNTSRGALVVEEDLVETLKNGTIAAAGLDVFENEPINDDHPFLDMENVLLSPHAAGADNVSHHDSCVMVGETISELYRGGWPAECIMNMKGVSGWGWNRG